MYGNLKVIYDLTDSLSYILFIYHKIIVICQHTQAANNGALPGFSGQ